jgi:hypothetical protein
MIAKAKEKGTNRQPANLRPFMEFSSDADQA